MNKISYIFLFILNLKLLEFAIRLDYTKFGYVVLTSIKDWLSLWKFAKWKLQNLIWTSYMFLN